MVILPFLSRTLLWSSEYPIYRIYEVLSLLDFNRYELGTYLVLGAKW